MQIEDVQQYRTCTRMSAVQNWPNYSQEGYINEEGEVCSRTCLGHFAIFSNMHVDMKITSNANNSMQYVFRIPLCTIVRIVKEVTKAIFDCLRDYLK
ncbi:hypothetical protein PR048_006478, partial [Dryococelus australis]